MHINLEEALIKEIVERYRIPLKEKEINDIAAMIASLEISRKYNIPTHVEPSEIVNLLALLRLLVKEKVSNFTLPSKV